MQELAELSSETRDIALSRFRLPEPHLEQHRIVAADAGVPFRTAQLFLTVTPNSALTYVLEPSAGTGRIIDAIRRNAAMLTATQSRRLS
jgi:hypothetical protein